MTFRLAAVTLSSALIACTPSDGDDTDGTTADSTSSASSDGSATPE